MLTNPPVDIAGTLARFADPLPSLLDEAWAVTRANLPAVIRIAAPGAKRYEIDEFRNEPSRFATISVTGRSCALNCAHCGGRLLETMLPATTPQALIDIGKRLLAGGCQGVLVSGGADRYGRVPLEPFLSALAELKSIGLQVIVHCGLVDRKIAEGLRSAGVDQAMMDVIGDVETIRRVYHLDREPEDYARSLECLKNAGVPIAPHVVVGLHFGELLGEKNALAMIARTEPDRVVVVAMTPLSGTLMANTTPAAPDAVGRVVALARLLNPRTPVTLGCARPAASKDAIDSLAVRAGVTAIAYAGQAAVHEARRLGLQVEFLEACCSLV